MLRYQGTNPKCIELSNWTIDTIKMCIRQPISTSVYTEQTFYKQAGSSFGIKFRIHVEMYKSEHNGEFPPICETFPHVSLFSAFENAMEIGIRECFPFQDNSDFRQKQVDYLVYMIQETIGHCKLDEQRAKDKKENAKSLEEKLMIEQLIYEGKLRLFFDSDSFYSCLGRYAIPEVDFDFYKKELLVEDSFRNSCLSSYAEFNGVKLQSYYDEYGRFKCVYDPCERIIDEYVRAYAIGKPIEDDEVLYTLYGQRRYIEELREFRKTGIAPRKFSSVVNTRFYKFSKAYTGGEFFECNETQEYLEDLRHHFLKIRDIEKGFSIKPIKV